MEPSLAQPSQAEDFGIGNFLIEGTSDDKEGCKADDTSDPEQNKATEEKGERGLAINGKNGNNNGWNFQRGWSEDRIHKNAPIPNYHPHQ